MISQNSKNFFSRLQSTEVIDAPELMRALHLLKKQHPSLMSDEWYGELSEDSPDWYGYEEMDVPPPFEVSLIEARTRIGYRWIDEFGEAW